MSIITIHQVRQRYLDFFKRQQHQVIPSAGLVPQNDPTTLFTSSGMQPLVPYLLGADHPEGTRLVNSQKCFRSQDIEEVGDNRHTTFFEMLGNWSLGDYFKHEQLRWIFQFLTDELGFDPGRLYVTVFSGAPDLSLPADEVSVEIWQELFSNRDIEAIFVSNPLQGMQDGRIFAYPQHKNWWSRSGEPEKMPVGEPGGPDSELFYDFGEELGCHENSPWSDQPCHPNCDCGRFMEIGNSVFMQYLKQEDGSFGLLPKQNVDFGGGLERLTAALQNTPDVFNIDIFAGMKQKLEELSGHQYGETTKFDNGATPQLAMRVIMDHVRAAVFLAADGVLPGNKAQAYFARRLLRRALRYGHLLELPSGWLSTIAECVVKEYQEVYVELADAQIQMTEAFATEERKFSRLLQQGLKRLAEVPLITPQIAFDLYQSHGFPFELTQEIARERGQDIAEEDFQAIVSAHQDQSRTASAGMFKGGLADRSAEVTAFHTATHLLHAALRQVLGKSVQQKGSNITEERLRFDYACDAVPTEEQLKLIIDQVNAWISASLPVTKSIMPKQEALDSGALAFFGEKYPETVTVYTIGEGSSIISRELCGGPHVSSTSEIPRLTIRSDKNIGQNVRRIYLEVRK